jgi:hypothetical protein
MRKGLGRSAALLAMSGGASLILTLGPGLAAAHAADDGGKRPGVTDCVDGRRDDGKGDDWLHDKDRKKCVPGVGAGVGAGAPGVGAPGVGAPGVGAPGVGAPGVAPPAGAVSAGGGGMADDGSSPLLPLAGAGLGVALLGAGLAARRRNQGAHP